MPGVEDVVHTHRLQFTDRLIHVAADAGATDPYRLGHQLAVRFRRTPLHYIVGRATDQQLGEIADYFELEVSDETVRGRRCQWSAQPGPFLCLAHTSVPTGSRSV
jgi:hypothetical protein